MLGPRLANPSAWQSPPHVALANLGYISDKRSGVASNDQIVRFVRKYGPLGVESSEMGDPGSPFWLELETFRETQERLREAWIKRDHRLFIDAQNVKSALGFEHLLHINWDVRRGALEMRLASCYDFIAILLTRDLAEKHAKVCRNPSCPAPYFVAKRTDPIFCTRQCASATSVRNFRQRHKK